MVCRPIYVVMVIIVAGGLFAADNLELADAYYQTGLEQFKQNKIDDAVAKFNQSLAYRPDFPPALFKLGECYEKLKEPERAIRAYRLCIKLLDQLTERAKEDEELLSQAVKALEKLDVRGKQLQKIKSNHCARLLAVANECLGRKYPRFARRIIDLILVIEPANKPAQEMVDKMDGKKPAPTAETTKPKPDKPKPPDPKTEKAKSAAEYMSRGFEAKSNGDYKEAVQLFSEAIKLDSKNPEAYWERGGAYYQAGKYEQALADYSTLINKFGTQRDLRPFLINNSYYMRAKCYAAVGNYRSAIRDGEMFLKKVPTNPEMPGLIKEWKSKK